MISQRNSMGSPTFTPEDERLEHTSLGGLVQILCFLSLKWIDGCEPSVHLLWGCIYITEIHPSAMGENLLHRFSRVFLNLNWAAWQISEFGQWKKETGPYLLIRPVV